MCDIVLHFQIQVQRTDQKMQRMLDDPEDVVVSYWYHRSNETMSGLSFQCRRMLFAEAGRSIYQAIL